MDVATRIAHIIVTILFGALLNWLTNIGVVFTPEKTALIMAAGVAFFSALLELGIAILQKTFPNLKITDLLGWILLIPIRPTFLTKAERSFIVENIHEHPPRAMGMKGGEVNAFTLSQKLN